MTALNMAGRDWARRNGLTKCQVIDTYSPAV